MRVCDMPVDSFSIAIREHPTHIRTNDSVRTRTGRVKHNAFTQA